jgi:hypothetical protein
MSMHTPPAHQQETWQVSGWVLGRLFWGGGARVHKCVDTDGV